MDAFMKHYSRARREKPSLIKPNLVSALSSIKLGCSASVKEQPHESLHQTRHFIGGCSHRGGHLSFTPSGTWYSRFSDKFVCGFLYLMVDLVNRMTSILGGTNVNVNFY